MSKSPLNPKLFHTLNVGDVVVIVRDFHEPGTPEREPITVAIEAIDRTPDIGEDRSQGAPQIFVDIDGKKTCLNGAFVHGIISRVRQPGGFKPFNALYHEREAYPSISEGVWTRKGAMISVTHPFDLARSIIAHDPEKHVPFGLSETRFDVAWKQAGYPGARGVWDRFTQTFEQGRPPKLDGNGFTFGQVGKTWWLHLPKFKSFVERRLPLFVKTMAEVKDEGARTAKKFYQDYLDDEEFDRRRGQNEVKEYEPTDRFEFADDY